MKDCRTITSKVYDVGIETIPTPRKGINRGGRIVSILPLIPSFRLVRNRFPTRPLYSGLAGMTSIGMAALIYGHYLCGVDCGESTPHIFFIHYSKFLILNFSYILSIIRK